MVYLYDCFLTPMMERYAEKEESMGVDDDISSSESQGFLPKYFTQRQSRSKSSSRPVIYQVFHMTILLLCATSLFAIAITQVLHSSTATHSAGPDATSLSVSVTDENSSGLRVTSTKVLVAPCGNSSTEARARGCHFDNISFAWVHEKCFDGELSHSFRDTKFKWSLGPEGQQPISQDEAFSGDYPIVFASWGYHVRHCTWLWRKMHRAILGEGRATLDGITSDYMHTSHCETMLVDRRDIDMDAMINVVEVKYPDCGA
jgi:hypothetical protein